MANLSLNTVFAIFIDTNYNPVITDYIKIILPLSSNTISKIDSVLDYHSSLHHETLN